METCLPPDELHPPESAGRCYDPGADLGWMDAVAGWARWLPGSFVPRTVRWRSSKVRQGSQDAVTPGRKGAQGLT